MRAKPIIRVAGTADAERIGELDREWTPILGRTARLQMAASKGRLLVAELDGDPVGSAAHGRFFGYDFLELLAVQPAKRRQGIATALIRAVESRSRSGKLFTSTNRSNRPMRPVAQVPRVARVTCRSAGRRRCGCRRYRRCRGRAGSARRSPRWDGRSPYRSTARG